MQMDFGRTIENDVEGLSLTGLLTDAELDAVFEKPENAALFAAIYSPTFDKLPKAAQCQLWADLVKLVEASQATALGLEAAPEQTP